MRIGFDIHGTIDRNPNFFVILARTLRNEGHQVVIITGVPYTEEVRTWLMDYNNGHKWWDEFFSVVDYLVAKGHKYTIDHKNTYWFDEEVWDTAKGNFCNETKVDLHIDDMESYAKHFTTRFFCYKNSNEDLLIKTIYELAKL